MINKINIQTNMPVMMKQASKQANETNVTAQNFVSVPDKNLGMTALGNYGKSMINFANKLDIKPLVPTVFNDINSIDGERIYDSKGNLHSIVKETPMSKTTYYVPLDNQNAVDFIETIDKKTGKTVFTQHNHINSDGKYDEMYVSKFNAQTGIEEAFTGYENGKITYAGKNIKGKNGEDVHITKYYDNGDIFISEYNEKTKSRRSINISDDKKKIDYREERETPKGYNETQVEFYEGLPFSVERSSRSTIPNIIGLDALMNKDLIPAPKFDIKAWDKDLKNMAGEETRYSNGALESKKVMFEGALIESYFNTNSELERVVTPTMEIEVKNNEPIRIKQKLGENKFKETFFSENMTRVVYNDNGNEKMLTVDTKKMTPLSYHESETIDGEKQDKKSYYYNDFGMVDGIYTR